jgi:hypothetical protein
MNYQAFTNDMGLGGHLVGPSVKPCKQLFERGDGGLELVPSYRQCSGEKRIRSVERVKHPRALLFRGNVVVEKSTRVSAKAV